jgi:hypothetical protein
MIMVGKRPVTEAYTLGLKQWRRLRLPVHQFQIVRKLGFHEAMAPFI